MPPVKNIAQQRCYHHSAREAVARCPACGRYFCRECISEHEDRVLCAGCLAKLLQPRLARKYRLGGALQIVRMAVSLLMLWTAFYLLGQVLLTTPTSFHEGTIWQKLLP